MVISVVKLHIKFIGGFMKKFVIVALFVAALSIFSSTAFAVPGDYSLRLKAGPSFNLADYQNQVKFGGQFDYDLGFGWGIGLEVLMGVKSHIPFPAYAEYKIYISLYRSSRMVRSSAE